MLKNIREKNNLSQSQLASLVGISTRTLQDYEQGRKELSCAKAITVYKIAKALNCKFEDLIEINESPKV